MDRSRLEMLLARFSDLRVLVVGDFFLDRYWEIDRRLAEASLETGLEAHQIVDVRCRPGAAGTVAANLRGLGVNVLALGVIGDDGEGYELKRELRRMGVDAQMLIECPDRFTPTYTKPMRRESDEFGAHELNRLDIKNRSPLPADVEDLLSARLRQALDRVHGVVIADQVSEPNCGVVTERLRRELCAQARARPEQVFAADSRERIGLFEDVILKPNAREAVGAVRNGIQGDPTDVGVAEACGLALAARARRPVFVTLGAGGILLCTTGACEHVPARPALGPIDPVGAGDSVMAGLVSSLCAGASLREAALIGNLAASVTIRQIGTTGTASPEQLRLQFEAGGNFSAP
jgi:rfaE bifunctional protein kinase chain/domain